MGLRRRVMRWFLGLPPRWQVRVAMLPGLVGSNIVGILVVAVLLVAVVPMPFSERQQLLQTGNIVFAFAFLVVAAGVAVAFAWRLLHPVVTLLAPGRRYDSTAPATPDEQRAVLSTPRRIFVLQALLWALGSLALAARAAGGSWGLGLTVLLIVGLAGWTTSCLTYLVAERTLRPVARTVLVHGIPERRYVRTVAGRAMFAWALGTGVAAIGTVLVGAVALNDPGTVHARQLAVATIVMGLLTLVAGALSSYAAAQASSQPIRTLRAALARVQEGDLDAHVGIYDGTEIGMLQAGFNAMIDGLREREQMRDLFGRHVGADVARTALASGVQLGGEAREVAVLFVDIIGSTSLAEHRPPEAVVAVLNRFFDVVVTVVHDHGGWVNKFEGDAALAVWGAPTDLPDRDTAALTAARVLGEELERRVPEVQAGIGVAAGTAVAGNVGTRARYEYTVIGDPVNVAARLTGEAKTVPRRVVASWLLVSRADPEEAARWTELEPITVRGRSSPTRIGTPV